MSKSLKQLVDANIQHNQDAIRRIRFTSLGLTKEERDAMLKKVEQEANEEMYKSIAALIIEATDKEDSTILSTLFGPTAHRDYCTSAMIKELEKSLEQDRSRLYPIYLYKTFNSLFLAFGFYYACYKGSLPLIRYYLEQQPFVEDMGNVTANVRGLEKYFPNTPALNGPPLKLATISNKTECVEYLYENTEAMAESECEDFPDRRSNLEIATTNQNVSLVRFLLSHAADPNAPSSDSFTSVFDLALKTLNIGIIAAYLEAGAMVDRHHIQDAIKARASLPILQLLFARCINRENLRNPYLLTAVSTGDISYLELIESILSVSSWQTIFAYHEDLLPARLVHTATHSGSLAMLQRVAEQHHIDVKAIALAEIAEFETCVQSGNLHRGDPIRVSRTIGDTLIQKATSHVALLQFYFETLGLTLSEEALKLQCKASDGLRPISYFLSLLEGDGVKKQEFRNIAIDFETLPLNFLFRIFNTPLILDGNPHGNLFFSVRDNNFISLIAHTIQKTTKDQDIVAIYREASQDPAALKGALFYFCTELFAKEPQNFIDFFGFVRAGQVLSASQVIAIDETNCLGTTLAHFASQQRNHHVVDFLIARGANPDKPNNDGKTLLGEYLRGFYYEKDDKQKAITYVQEHMREQQIGHSLIYKLSDKYLHHDDGIILLLTASKGDIKPLSIDVLIKTILMSHKDRYLREKCFTILFTYLADLHAIRLVQRLREPKTIDGGEAESLAEEFKYYLQQFEKAEGLSAYIKARRLATQSMNSATNTAFFASSSDVAMELERKSGQASKTFDDDTVFEFN